MRQVFVFALGVLERDLNVAEQRNKSVEVQMFFFFWSSDGVTLNFGCVDMF
jgi:hypothetical protein